MFKALLLLTILVSGQLTFANIRQSGCTHDMVVEAESIAAKSVAAYNAGAVSSPSKFITEINLVETRLCAGQISLVSACPQLKRAGHDLVDTLKRQVEGGSGSYESLVSGIEKKNEIEIFCSK